MSARRYLKALVAAHDALHRGDVQAAHVALHAGIGTAARPIDSASGRPKLQRFDREFLALAIKRRVLAMYVAVEPDGRVTSGGSAELCTRLDPWIEQGLRAWQRATPQSGENR